MTTTKKQLLEALAATGERLEELRCFVQPHVGQRRSDEWGPVQEVAADALPEREYDEGYGGVEGEPILCFGPRYVYFRGCYDGAEWIAAVPRTPEAVAGLKPEYDFTSQVLPVVGGG